VQDRQGRGEKQKEERRDGSEKQADSSVLPSLGGPFGNPRAIGGKSAEGKLERHKKGNLFFCRIVRHSNGGAGARGHREREVKNWNYLFYRFTELLGRTGKAAM